jgi:hypothetical protein
MSTLRITQWQAWAPGLDSTQAWQAWVAAPHRVPDQGEQPACEFLPAMQRRRLSRLARICLQVAWPLCGDDEQVPLVFGSRHGETPRTYALLSDVAAGQPLSPTQFGLSVHNAIAGQWSILRGQRGESVAIAGEADTFEHAMLEAALLLADGATKAVIVLVAEEQPAPAYADWIDDVPFSYALALRVEAAVPNPGATDSQWNLRMMAKDETSEAAATWPHALRFLQALLGAQDSLISQGGTRQWQWQRMR